MKRPVPRPPKLSDFLLRKLFTSTDPKAWAQIAEWQKRKLVAVQPHTKDAAFIEITDAGREEIGS